MHLDILLKNSGIIEKDRQVKYSLWRDFMRTHGFLKGMAAGLVLGACATMICDPVSDRQRHRMQRKTEGVFRSIGNIIDNAIDMIK